MTLIWSPNQKQRKGLVFTVGSILTLFGTGSLMMVVYLVKRWFETEEKQRLERRYMRDRITQRFDRAQIDSLNIVSGLLPMLNITLNEVLQGDLEDLSAEIRAEKKKSKNKAILWDQLKMKTLIKFVTVCYTVSSLLLFVKIQINILTRREYLDSTVQLGYLKDHNKHNISSWNFYKKFWNVYDNLNIIGRNKEKDLLISKEEEERNKAVKDINEQSFLSLSWWLLNIGYRWYYDLATEAVNLKFKKKKIDEKISKEDLIKMISDIFENMNQKIFLSEESTNDLFKPIFLPRNEQELNLVLRRTLEENTVNDIDNGDIKIDLLMELMGEVNNFLRENSTLVIMELLLNESFTYSLLQLDENLKEKADQSGDTDVMLAIFITTYMKICKEMLDKNLINNKFLQYLANTNGLNDFSASIYGKFTH